MMPTGYTADVGDGKVTEFPDFAINCARAFGALVTLRDDMGAPVPETIEPSPYYAERVRECRAELERLRAMSLREVMVACADSAAKHRRERDEYRAKKEATIARYKAMLVHARAWEPPTSEHTGLKTFMVEQLTESIRFDGPSSPDIEAQVWPQPPADPAAWHAGAIAEAERVLVRAEQSHSEEVERARSRTEWLKALRGSLAPVPYANAATGGVEVGK